MSQTVQAFRMAVAITDPALGDADQPPAGCLTPLFDARFPLACHPLQKLLLFGLGLAWMVFFPRNVE